MSKTAIIFPGQGSQKVGMANDLYEHNEAATTILNQAQNAVDFDILETMYRYPHITDYMFVSGDSDLRYVIKRLKYLNLTI